MRSGSFCVGLDEPPRNNAGSPCKYSDAFLQVDDGPELVGGEVVEGGQGVGSLQWTKSQLAFMRAVWFR